MPEEMIEELAWQHEHPEPEPDWWLAIEAGPTAQEPAATEPKPNTKLCCAVDHGPGCASRIYHGTDCPGAESCPVKQYEDERWKQEDAEMEAALCGNREPAAQEPATATGPELGYLMTLIERLEDADDEKDELDAANELFYVMYSDQPEKEIDVGQLLKDAIRLVNKLAEGDRAARADEPDDVDYFAVFGESVGRGLGMTEKTEPAAQEPAPVPGTAERAAQETADPDALHFHSLAEYKAWAAGVSTQECHAYWDALSDFDWRCLWDDLDDEAAAQEPATKAEERC
jgi:hypothetical protein